jgi:ribosomal protein S18 acetylase RimI-like enzyme
MAEIEIRPAVSSDISILTHLNHSCETTHVWQMDNSNDLGQIEIRFKEMRLPRSLQLEYPKKLDTMADTWTQHSLFLVARLQDKLVGYLILDISIETNVGRITDLVVDASARRQKIATGLLVSARDWLKSRGIRRVIIEMQAKNHPAIAMARKMKMDFCGFIDSYYANRDIAVFYTSVIKN